MTYGVFADEPAKGVTGGGVISGGLHSFVLSAALELRNGLRINCVSPGMVEDSVKTMDTFSPTSNLFLWIGSQKRITNRYMVTRPVKS